MDEWKSWWRANFGQNVPLAHLLRGQISNRWLRIHSLPESKRYAETDDEYAVLLSRQNAVANEVLGLDSQCLLFVGRYCGGSEVDMQAQNLPHLENVSFSWFESFQNSGAYEPEHISIWCATTAWYPEHFERLIKAVADDKERNILFASLETGEAYAPYDGGADLFINSTSRRDELKIRFSSWLSSHPLGL